ncbi:hypothetical protein H8K52_08540 [Undibacterium seohonense]|uniref:Uncharacterized protein n=1 Tax=Undibacterium seohonense TaxID=1344950 RepID=A0ABR6X4U5_9BURK|nr:two-component regulator propeller domain-containing protein [Undibacterium seohonense]MBC3807391.1 hypothetical protein [Undibacterium seohonense]
MHRLRFDHFSIDQGLPSTGIMTVYQTRNGFVWMGTANGLVRYDGRHIRLFSHMPALESTISHDRIFSLFEDDQQRLWIGTRRGLNVFDLRSDVIQRIPMPVDMHSKQQMIYGISQAEEGRLWLATSTGLMLFDPNSKKFIRWQADAALETDFQGEVRALISDKAGGVWIGQGSTVAHINHRAQLQHHVKTTQAQLGMALQQSQTQVRSLAFDSQGQLWVGMTGGLRI